MIEVSLQLTFFLTPKIGSILAPFQGTTITQRDKTEVEETPVHKGKDNTSSLEEKVPERRSH